MAGTKRIRLAYGPRLQFLPFHKRKQRWAIIVAHRRAGKTVACINDLIKRAVQLHRPHGRYAYVAPYLGQGKEVAWEYLKRFSAPIRGAIDPNESELWVQLMTGARIRIHGADNPNRLRGGYLDGVIMDEFADMRPSVWSEVIRPMLADREGWATWIGTPNGHNAFYDLWADPDRKQAPADWYKLMLKASETGIIPPDELADARKGQSEDEYLQEWECSFEAAIQGAYFATQMRQARTDGRIGKVPLDPARPVSTFWDIGKTDSTAVWFHQNRGQMHHLVDYYENSGEGVEFYARILKEKQAERGWQYGKHYGPHDLDNSHWILPGRETVRDTARNLGIEFIVVSRIANKQDAIEAGRNFLAMCWIDQEHCAKGIEALDHYRKAWDEDRKTWKKAPEHDWASHGADAFMTGACGFTPEFIPPPSDRYAKPRTRQSAWAA